MSESDSELNESNDGADDLIAPDAGDAPPAANRVLGGAGAAAGGGGGQPAVDDPAFDALLDYLKRARGFDFSGYKRVGLMRRVHRRMQQIRVETFADYHDYLEVHPDEFVRLFDNLLINVTSFFRDAHVWEYVRDHVVPAILKGKPNGGPVRVWSAGCATGEEAYTLAILLAEAMGVEAFKERVKIYATDVDDDALNTARLAGYGAQQVQAVPPEYLGKYFDRDKDRYVFHKDLRRSVIFGRHDLLTDAPISRVDLLTSRNALMYFNAEVQVRILTRFHFALNPEGFLVLGKAETLLTHSDLFAPVDLRRRIFKKVQQASLRERLLVLAQAGGYEVPGTGTGTGTGSARWRSTAARSRRSRSPPTARSPPPTTAPARCSG